MLRRSYQWLIRALRANFFAGLFIAVPFAITIGFLYWVWLQIKVPLANLFQLANQPKSPWYPFISKIDAANLSEIYVPLFSLAVLLFLVFVLGVITRSIIGRMALAGVENVVSRLPLIGMLYVSIKQLGEAFLTPDGHSKFQRAVAVHFPSKDSWAIGFVTGKGLNILPESATASDTRDEILTIFVPTSPLPTAGFVLMIRESETLPLQISVPEALKLVISGGMVAPGESHRIKPATRLTQIITESTRKKREEVPGDVKT